VALSFVHHRNDADALRR